MKVLACQGLEIGTNAIGIIIVWLGSYKKVPTFLEKHREVFGKKSGLFWKWVGGDSY